MNKIQRSYRQQLKVERKETIALLRAFDKQGQPNSAPHARIRRKLARIEAALNRIQVGAYGSCLTCGEPVSRQRLNAMAYAELCLTCQQNRETV